MFAPSPELVKEYADMVISAKIRRTGASRNCIRDMSCTISRPTPKPGGAGAS